MQGNEQQQNDVGQQSPTNTTTTGVVEERDVVSVTETTKEQQDVAKTSESTVVLDTTSNKEDNTTNGGQEADDTSNNNNNNNNIQQQLQQVDSQQDEQKIQLEMAMSNIQHELLHLRTSKKNLDKISTLIKNVMTSRKWEDQQEGDEEEEDEDAASNEAFDEDEEDGDDEEEEEIEDEDDEDEEEVDGEDDDEEGTDDEDEEQDDDLYEDDARFYANHKSGKRPRPVIDYGPDGIDDEEGYNLYLDEYGQPLDDVTYNEHMESYNKTNDEDDLREGIYWLPKTKPNKAPGSSSKKPPKSALPTGIIPSTSTTSTLMTNKQHARSLVNYSDSEDDDSFQVWKGHFPNNPVTPGRPKKTSSGVGVVAPSNPQLVVPNSYVANNDDIDQLEEITDDEDYPSSTNSKSSYINNLVNSQHLQKRVSPSFVAATPSTVQQVNTQRTPKRNTPVHHHISPSPTSHIIDDSPSAFHYPQPQQQQQHLHQQQQHQPQMPQHQPEIATNWHVESKKLVVDTFKFIEEHSSFDIAYLCMIMDQLKTLSTQFQWVKLYDTVCNTVQMLSATTHHQPSLSSSTGVNPIQQHHTTPQHYQQQHQHQQHLHQQQQQVQQQFHQQLKMQQQQEILRKLQILQQRRQQHRQLQQQQQQQHPSPQQQQQQQYYPTQYNNQAQYAPQQHHPSLYNTPQQQQPHPHQQQQHHQTPLQQQRYPPHTPQQAPQQQSYPAYTEQPQPYGYAADHKTPVKYVQSPARDGAQYTQVRKGKPYVPHETSTDSYASDFNQTSESIPPTSSMAGSIISSSNSNNNNISGVGPNGININRVEGMYKKLYQQRQLLLQHQKRLQQQQQFLQQLTLQQQKQAALAKHQPGATAAVDSSKDNDIDLGSLSSIHSDSHYDDTYDDENSLGEEFNDEDVQQVDIALYDKLVISDRRSQQLHQQQLHNATSPTTTSTTSTSTASIQIPTTTTTTKTPSPSTIPTDANNNISTTTGAPSPTTNKDEKEN
ncbi:hypothetical protein SAMD00019534_073050 [Acytostelium subglobosum LB1]|uniref:hypothetical protein n=1 Tax=Acytostelium subglobosum LB1 TaxID=1410327 RepID=UPI0006449B0A|nr:hypothetical protein SAMD00019534_073050 [Acytostelium subglobosum LB1]GAM24130.1 hypothetical protein SAMD00019534_073050 [Acytostelium subglobosum LB1]|eukprot:XP_012753166.1 hypothetical protein SAMD00019534_073050 [Acytostelium subglobosum LB1]